MTSRTGKQFGKHYTVCVHAIEHLFDLAARCVILEAGLDPAGIGLLGIIPCPFPGQTYTPPRVSRNLASASQPASAPYG